MPVCWRVLQKLRQEGRLQFPLQLHRLVNFSRMEVDATLPDPSVSFTIVPASASASKGSALSC